MHINLTPEGVRAAIARVGQNVGEIALHFARDSVGSLATIVTSAIIFLYVFLALVVNGPKVIALFRDLNPFGQEVTDLYLAKMGAMVTATVRGQFIIAVCQGVAGAISIYIGGFHDGFFMFAIFLSGAVGHPAGQRHRHDPVRHRNGVVRQRLRRCVRRPVPPHRGDEHRQLPAPDPGAQERAPDSALMLLSVFAGIGMFGSWGIVHRPGADDRHRHDDQRLPRRVQGRTAGRHTDDDDPKPTKWRWRVAARQNRGGQPRRARTGTRG